MMGGSAKAPPALLPGEHFAAALLFLLAGGTALIAFADDFARGTYLAPRVAATTHLFTLGWITTSIMGALYQFLPVALDQPIRSVRLAHATFVLYVPGLMMFILGIAGTWHTLLLAGAATFGTGILLFIGNMALTLRRSVRRDVTWWALAFATFYLGITLLLGGTLAGNLRFGYLGAARLRAMTVHLHVAIAGWVLLVMIGVAHRLLPMFLLSHGVKHHYAKAAVALVATGAGVLAFLHHAPRLLSVWLPALCLTLGCAAFVIPCVICASIGHPAVVSVYVMMAVPSSTTTSYTSPSVTMSRPISGSITVLSASRTALSNTFVMGVVSTG
jgi:hypothetical protein